MPEVPDRYPVSLAGRPYLVSHKGGRFGRRSLPVQRGQTDTSSAVGEQSLSTEDLWRRSIESWHRGAGQSSYDRAGGDESRFDNSLGVDPWTKWQLSLLGGTERKLASTSPTVKLAVAGGYLYCIDGQALKYTQTVTAAGAAVWTTVTGTPAVAGLDIASDGFNVYVAYGPGGLYKTTRGAASVSAYSNIDATTIGYVKGRLMVGKGRRVYNLTEPSTGEVSLWSSDYSFGGSATVLEVDMPGGFIEVGDFLVVALAWSSTADVVEAPDGFTLIQAGHSYDAPLTTPQLGFAVYWGIYTGQTSVTFTMSTDATTWSAGVAGYRDVDTSDPITASAAATYNVDAATIDSPSITTTTRNARVVTISFKQNAGAGLDGFFAPAGFTAHTGATNDADPTVESVMADKTYPTAGATGVLTWTKATPGDVYDDFAAVTFAMRVAEGTPLLTQQNSDWTWVGFAEGQGDIYAAGYSGDKSLVYKTQIKDDATGLDAPSVAGQLPDGEIVRSIYGYLGYVFIGTDRGVRMATSDANGNLLIGALIPTPAPVRCFEGQDRFVWYGLEQFDVSAWAAGTYDGLGRLDLRESTQPTTPAYASDLMVTTSTGTTEQVQSVVTFQNVRVLSVADSGGASRGVYAETAAKVANGWLDSGLISYGIADTKVAAYADVRHRALVGSVTVSTSTDEAAFVLRGTSNTAGSTAPAAFSAGPTRGVTHELRLGLARANGADTVGPVVTRITLRSEPAPTRGRVFQVPLMLYQSRDVKGQTVTMDVAAALALIEGLFATQTLVPYKEGATTVDVFVKDYEFVAESATSDGKANQGICTVTLKAPGA